MLNTSADMPAGVSNGSSSLTTRPSRAAGKSYDSLQRFDKNELVQRIRSLEMDLDAERQRRSALAYDQRVLLAKMIRLETEIILLQAEKSHPD